MLHPIIIRRAAERTACAGWAWRCVPIAFGLMVSWSTAVLAQQPAAAALVESAIVTGDGVVRAAPDRAWLDVGAESRAASAREAQRRNTELMMPILDKIRAAGIPAEAIRTIGYDVQYEWEFVNNKRVGKGYVARNTVEIRVDTIERVGEMLELAAGSGATSLGGVRFDLKNRAQLERDALRLAVESARARAQAVATGAGRAVDRILKIEEQGAGAQEPPRPMFRAAATAADAAPPIATGEIEVRASVVLTVSLK
jgi:uncharacterized protein YggE